MTTYDFKKLHPDHLTITQARELSGLGHAKIKVMIDLGLIKCLKLNTLRTTCYLIPPEEIQTLKKYKGFKISKVWGFSDGQ